MECYTCSTQITKEVYCGECGRSGCQDCMPIDGIWAERFCPAEIENHSPKTCRENYELAAAKKSARDHCGECEGRIGKRCEMSGDERLCDEFQAEVKLSLDEWKAEEAVV